MPGYSAELKPAVVGLGEGLWWPWEPCLLPPRQLPHPDWASGVKTDAVTGLMVPMVKENLGLKEGKKGEESLHLRG